MNRFVLIILIITCFQLSSDLLCLPEQGCVDLSMINDSNGTLLITFMRHLGSQPRAKLLEPGESIDFGRVYEASVQSYSTLWGYIAPAKQVIFSTSLIKSLVVLDDIVIRIKGIVGRSIFQPFGHWDYEVVSGKKVLDPVCQKNPIAESESVLDAFPTAKRKIMYTPRYILGLPQNSGLDDALEASIMLACTWRSQCADGELNKHKLVANVMYLIDASRKAFQYGQADVPLHIPVEMRSPLQYVGAEEDAANMVWS